jgi:hypothetical protein
VSLYLVTDSIRNDSFFNSVFCSWPKQQTEPHIKNKSRKYFLIFSM